MRFKIFLATSAFALSLFSPLLTKAEPCELHSPARLPVSTLSGAWSQDHFDFVDTASDAILRYGTDGEYRGEVSPGAASGPYPFSPSAAVPTDRGLLLQMAHGRLAQLNRSYQPTEMISLYGVADDQRHGVVKGLFSWDLAGESLVFCGDVKTGNNWTSGFLRAPLHNPRDFEFLDSPLPVLDPELVYCRIGYDYIATMGATAYILREVEGDATRIMSYGPDTTAGTPVGPSYRARPDLIDEGTSRSFRDAMRVVANSKMPAGLYAWQGRLYVLRRAPGDEGTTWSLDRIHPSTGELEGSTILPSTADHLVVVPGPNYWAFLEKGPVEGYEMQTVLGLRIVPSDSIRQISDMAADPLCP